MYPTPTAKTSTPACISSWARATGLASPRGLFHLPSVMRMTDVLKEDRGTLLSLFKDPIHTSLTRLNASFILVIHPFILWGSVLNFSLKVHLFLVAAATEIWSIKMLAVDPNGITSTRVASLATLISLRRLVMNFFSSLKLWVDKLPDASMRKKMSDFWSRCCPLSFLSSVSETSSQLTDWESTMREIAESDNTKDRKAFMLLPLQCKASKSFAKLKKCFQKMRFLWVNKSSEVQYRY